MCLDHLSRRDVLGSAGVLAAGGAASRFARLPAGLAPKGAARKPHLLSPPRRATAADGTSAYSMAMHLHSSWSEFWATMHGHMEQAAINDVDVVWWTDHDWRMEGWYYRTKDHFSQPDSQNTGTWTWLPQQAGPVASGAAQLVGTPVSPNDPNAAAGSLSVQAQSSSTAPATVGMYCNDEPSDWNYRSNLDNQTLEIDVLVEPGWVNGYLEFAISSSYYPASGGRPAGYYSLSYQITPGGTAGSVAQGTNGIVTIPAPQAGGWATITIDPASDIATIWPDLDARDFSLYKLFLNAVSTGDNVSGYFGYLRFNRANSGSACFELQAELMTELAAQYPSITQQQGIEVSWKFPHVNWFGGNVAPPSYGDTTPSEYVSWLLDLIPEIHAGGGCLSYNHPFGTAPHGTYSAAKQAQLLASVAADLLPGAGNGNQAACGCDYLEVGYVQRAGVQLDTHVALWDVMSRNAYFLTGTGTSDDHDGTGWAKYSNNWITSAWAASTAQSDLLAAMTAGRSFCGSLTGFAGNLDMLVDDECPMGSASVSALPSRTLEVLATIPEGCTLQVLQGDVDYAGTGGLASNAQMIGSYTAAQLAAGEGSATMPVDTTTDSFVRTQAVDADGNTQGLSNPVWLLRSTPPGGIPTARAA